MITFGHCLRSLPNKKDKTYDSCIVIEGWPLVKQSFNLDPLEGHDSSKLLFEWHVSSKPHTISPKILFILLYCKYQMFVGDLGVRLLSRSC